jgi:V/A-type H+/Na+-transporting ATPase subunit D
MIAGVNPTRMELLRLKKRLALAARGHKLLKDKRDELMRQLLEIIDEVKDKRMAVEKEFNSILELFVLAKASMAPFQVEQALIIPSKKISVSVRQKNMMSVRVPEYSKEVSGDIISYGFLNTSGDTDVSLDRFDKFIEDLLNLAEKEKAVQLMATEIEETRRRVNALEYRLIPELEETIRFITSRLEENERSSLVRLMKVKEIVRSH